MHGKLPLLPFSRISVSKLFSLSWGSPPGERAGVRIPPTRLRIEPLNLKKVRDGVCDKDAVLGFRISFGFRPSDFGRFIGRGPPGISKFGTPSPFNRALDDRIAN